MEHPTSGTGRLPVQPMMGKMRGEEGGRRRSIAWTIMKRVQDTEGMQLSGVARWWETIATTRLPEFAR